MKGYWGVLRNNRFIFYALIPYFSYAAYFAYIVESPFLLTTLGLSPRHISYSYIGVSLPYILENFLGALVFFNVSLWKRLWGEGTLFFVIGGMLFVLQMYLSPWPLVTSFMAIAVLTFGNGFYCR